MPVSSATRRTLQCVPSGGFTLSTVRNNSATRSSSEARQPMRVEPPAPVADRLHRELEALRDGGVALARGRREDDLRPPHVAEGKVRDVAIAARASCSVSLNMSVKRCGRPRGIEAPGRYPRRLRKTNAANYWDATLDASCAHAIGPQARL